MHLVVLAVIISAVRLHAVPCSSDNDKLLGSTCFEFVDQPLTGVGPDDSLYDFAEDYCSKHGKHLATVKSPGEQYFLANALKSLQWSEAMVGLRYKETPWAWTADGTYLRGQGCARTNLNSGIIANLPSTFSDTMSREKCVDFCAKEGHIFAAIQDGSYCYCSSTYIWDELASNCSTPCSGRSDEQCGSAFNSAIQFAAEDAYDNWLTGRPTTGGNCASVKVDGRINPWADTSCTLSLPFLCKFIDTKATPYGADRSACSHNACYYYFSTPELSWQAADRFCIKGGGRLATVESEDRQGIVSAILSDPHIKAKQIWIGASNRDWYFPDDSPLSLRDGWVSSNEPVNQELHSCADLIAGALSTDGDLVYGYRSRPCNRVQDSDVNSLHFVCSSPADDEDVTMAPLATLPTPNAFDVSSMASKPSTKASEVIQTDQQKADQEVVTTTKLLGITRKILQSDLNAVRQVAVDPSNQQDLTFDDSDFGSEDLPWWSVLLIVLAVLILVALVLLVLVYLLKRGRSNGKASGRISPLSTRPIIGVRSSQRFSYANSRQSSARTSHGRNNQVLLY